MVDGVRGGSEAAFEALFDRYHRGVLGFCRHMLGSVEEAEDAVQHTFLSAYRELAGSGKQVVLRPWLYTIARNRCLTMLRGRVRHSGGELVEPPTEHLAAAVERRSDLRDLLRDVAGLPEEQRSALVLSELGDMSHDEIADVLGCRRDKVKALVFQARSSLIASREARETPCGEIREQLANLRGGSLRRNELRRHLSECAGCRDFREQVRAQRRDLAVVLPVAPTVGLKSGVIGAALGSSAAAPTAVVAGGSAASGAFAAKVLVAAAIAGGGTVAVKEVVDHADRPAAVPTDVRSTPAPARHESSGAPGAPGAPPSVMPLRGSEGRSAPADRTHGKLVPPGRADAAPGHAKAGHPGNAAAPGHGGKPAKGETPLGPAGKPEKPANAAAPGKPETPGNGHRPAGAAKPGKAPKPAQGPQPGKAQQPGTASKPATAPKPAKAQGPVAASSPATPPKPPQASKPAKPATPAGQAAPKVTVGGAAPPAGSK